LWGHTLGENWPPEQTSSYASCAGSWTPWRRVCTQHLCG